MTTTTEAGAPVDLHVASGRIGARRWGSPEAPLVICIPGLPSDERIYEFLGSRLGSDRRQVLAVSPRGRGRSQVTAPGSYGWKAHAQDIAEIADTLGQHTFAVIGWSFGAAVGMQLARDAPGRIRRLVLIDAVGRPDASALAPVAAGLEHLGALQTTPAEYVERSLAAGTMAGCEPQWRNYLTGSLEPAEGAFRSRTSKSAVLEDALYGMNQDPYAFWPAVTMPALLVRAGRPILPGLGFMVTEADRDRFLREIPLAQVVEIDANHLCVGMLEETTHAIASFLGSQ